MSGFDMKYGDRIFGVFQAFATGKESFRERVYRLASKEDYRDVIQLQTAGCWAESEPGAVRLLHAAVE